MNNSTVVIQCEKLTKTFAEGALKVAVFHELDFTVNAGELIGVVGQSGAGKSTFLHLLGGLDKPTSGTVSVCGKQINTLSEAKKSRLRNESLGFVYQFHHLLPEFDTIENVAMPLLLRGDPMAKAMAAAEELIVKVGLKDRMTHRIGELSGGERQRIAFARALVTSPACILADEPTGNLDTQTAEKVYQLMLELNQEYNTSFVIVTHNLSLTERLHKTYQLENGQLRQL
jgi:lipoprotein-releasing system ATP-binding protein